MIDIGRALTHACCFCCSCLLANNPGAATPVLERDAFDVDPALTGMAVRDFLLFSYYGGLIHIGSLPLSAYNCRTLSDIKMLALKEPHFPGRCTAGET